MFEVARYVVACGLLVVNALRLILAIHCPLSNAIFGSGTPSERKVMSIMRKWLVTENACAVYLRYTYMVGLLLWRNLPQKKTSMQY
jgi:hypothetical protein